MAGIHVSGGIYSGSGDVTIDWFKSDNDPYYVWLPDGTMTITSELGSWCLYSVWPGSQDYWKHQNGTVKITTPAGTLFQGVPVNADSSGRVGQFHNIEVNQNAYGASKDPVTFSSATEGSHLKLGGSLTITSGTFATNTSAANNNYLYEIVEGLILKTSGSFIQGASEDAGFPVGFRYNCYGNLKTGWIEGQDYNGGDGVQLVLSSGTTTITSSSASDVGLVFHDQRAGHLHSNSGTVRFEPGAGVTQKLRWNNNGGPIYNAIVSGGASSLVKGFMSGADYLTFAKDLTVDAGTIGLYGDKLRVTGNVVINSGTVDTKTSDTADNVHSMGSLYIKADGTYNASSYDTLINNANSDSYKFRVENGTFTHNDGTLILDASTNGGMYKNTGSKGKYVYNLTVKNDNTSQRAVQNVYGVTVANNLIVSGAGSDEASWDVGFYNAGDGGYIVSGLTTIINGAKLGRAVSSDSTFGKLTIGEKGWYDAPTGSFTLKDDFTIPSDNSTFTHNSGTAVIAGNVELMPTDYDSSETARHVFWDISQTGPGTFYIERPTVLERNFTKSGGDLTHYTKLTCGTDTSGSTITVNSGEWKMYGYYGNPYLYAKNEAYPVTITGSVTDPINWDTVDNGSRNPVTYNHIKWIDYQKDTTTGGGTTSGARIIVDGDCTFKGMTISARDRVEVSGQRIRFGDTLSIAASGLTVSGSVVEMTGAGNWSETGYQPFMGRDSASVIWNTTGYYSPNGGYLNAGWKNVLWNSEARVNQDGVFRNSNLIVAGQLDANNRAIGTTSRPSKIIVANGGTVSSSTNVFHASTFSNRGGLFTSSSAFAFDGAASSGGLINAGADSSIDNIFDGGGTIEGWVKLDSGGGGNVARLVSKDAYFLYFREDSFNNIRLQYTFSGGGAEWYTENNTFTFDNKWHHVAVTYDNSSLTNDPTIYLDGKVVPLGTIVRPTGSRSSDVGDVLYVGNNPSGIRTLDGSVGMLRMFSDIRTVEEIRDDMFNQKSDMVDDGALVLMYQFDEGQGTTVTDVSTNSNTGTITMGTSGWANGGTWTDGNKLGSETGVVAGNIYIGKHATNPTLFANSYFDINKRKMVSGSKMASKAHMETEEYYIATSGTGDTDWLNYQYLGGAPIGTHSDVKIVPPQQGLGGSRFTFDNNANNEQCNTLLNMANSRVRIVDNTDFYTQDFDNAGTWERGSPYGGTIHDDGSTPVEHNPIDIMDDIDSGFDTEELID